jgi:arylsulfatase A-like enzyme
MHDRRQFLRRSVAWGAVAGLSPRAWASRPCFWGAEPKPNVVVLMLDALRPDYTQVYGSRRQTTPFLNRLAQKSTVFDRAYSTSTWTAPACASFFSGHYPPAHGIVEGFMANSRRVERQDDKGLAEKAPEGDLINGFAPDMKLMAEYFAAEGYRCFGLATNPNIGPEIGYTKGFDEFLALDDAPAEEVLEALQDWQEALTQGSDPYFLYLHFMDVHKPYRARAPWYRAAKGRSEAEDAAERYRSELRYLDGQLETLFEQWKWGPETVVLVLSDHGEEFAEHGQIGHRFQMHRELSHIFMLATGAGLGQQPQRVQSLVGIHDMLPSLLELTGLNPPVEGTGLSFMPLLAQSGAAPAGSVDQAFPDHRADRVIFAHRRKTKLRSLDLWSATYKDWRMIRAQDGNNRLFDTRRDPFEQNPLSRSHDPQIFDHLVDQLDHFVSLGFTDRSVMRRITQTEAEAKLLEDLGYVDH